MSLNVPTVGTERNSMKTRYNTVIFSDDRKLVGKVCTYEPYEGESYSFKVVEDIESIFMMLDGSCINTIVFDYEYFLSIIDISDCFIDLKINMWSRGKNLYLILLTDDVGLCNLVESEQIGVDLIMQKSHASYVIENIRMLDFAHQICTCADGRHKGKEKTNE